jgi:hypothetical protein
MKEKIVCSAIHINDLREDHAHKPENIESGFVVAGLRHCNCFGVIKSLSDCDSFKKCKNTHGFITTFNRFVDREEGYIIAKKGRQIKKDKTVNKKCKILFSENLY